MTATTARTKDAPTARIPISAPRRRIRFPKKRISRNETAGIAGMIQALESTDASALQVVDFVEIGRPLVAVDEELDRQADPDLGRRDGDDEQREHLTGHRAAECGERDQVDVHRVEHQLDAHEDQHRVLPREDTVDTGAEEERAEDEVLVEIHRQSLRAMTTAPTRAARRSIETTSKGTR